MPASDRLRELGFEVAVPKIVERSMRTPGALARAIRDRRRDLGWTVERLARESGVDRSELERLELDGRGRYAAARSAVAALGISPSSLPHPRSMRDLPASPSTGSPSDHPPARQIAGRPHED